MARTAHEDFDFSTLSLKDLIEARDLYHFHLMSKANVVGTAVGLYLIRDEEDWPQDARRGRAASATTHLPRGLSAIRMSRDYSWPCIIVLVREWVDEARFRQERQARALEMRAEAALSARRPRGAGLHGRAPPVPQAKARRSRRVAWPQATFGGGLPALCRRSSTKTHMATIGCLVSDGHTTYALTARHACGEPGTPSLGACCAADLCAIGVSSDKQITRKLFSEVYPALPLRQTWLGLDVGLVRARRRRRLDAEHLWPAADQAAVRHLRAEPVAPQADRPAGDRHGRRLGPAAGQDQGAVLPLSLGRRFRLCLRFPDRAGARARTGAHHGDSGALWHLQMPGPDGKEDTRPLPKRDLRPLAIEWGAQVFAESGERSTYSVATSLSNVCKLLDVELVVEGNDGVSGVPGARSGTIRSARWRSSW